MIRIFIADDHEMFAEGLESLLAGEQDFDLIGKAGTAEATLRKVTANPPDVLLLDINLPDQSGLEVCRQLRARGRAKPNRNPRTLFFEASCLRSTRLAMHKVIPKIVQRGSALNR